MGGKWLELLKEIAPHAARIAIIFNPKTDLYAGYLRSLEVAAPSFAVQLITAPVRDVTEIEAATSVKDDETAPQTRRTVDPVVLRAARSACALAASFSG
jgi:putative ABC transport system substrate-binding protein